MLLTAEFLATESATQAVCALTAEGFSARDMELFSDCPVGLPSGILERRSYISLFAVLGAVMTGAVATAFVFFTERDYPLITGGMPLISAWSTGVISYEMTMAGAVAGTVLALLWEGRLILRRGRSVPPPALKEGSIFLRVVCAENLMSGVTRRLEQAGAVEIIKQPEAP